MTKPQSTGDIRDRAQDAAKLSQRIASNANAQGKDLNKWIFDHLEVPADARVLELCAGTGAQSAKFLERLTRGKLVSTDKSPDALDALTQKVGDMAHGRLHTIPSDMDQLNVDPPFDLIFCAYGLYYSAHPEHLLEKLASWLAPHGRIAIVGPHGPNNNALFSLLKEAGVVLPEYVTWTSQDFMPKLVVPWGEKHFQEVRISTLENPVTWKDAESLLTYWRNSTFYDASREAQVTELLKKHFAAHGVFQDAKHVMLAEMRDMH